MSDSSSSSDTSSLSSGSSSEDSDSDDDMDDTKLLLEIRSKLNRSAEKSVLEAADTVKTEEVKEDTDDISSPTISKDVEKRPTSIDERLKEQFNLEKSDSSLESPAKKRRIGLVQEIIISVSTDHFCNFI